MRNKPRIVYERQPIQLQDLELSFRQDLIDVFELIPEIQDKFPGIVLQI